MSTRGTLARREVGSIVLHLYDEMHDGSAHLEIFSTSGHNSYLNLIIPTWAVPDLKSLLSTNTADDAALGMRIDHLWNIIKSIHPTRLEWLLEQPKDEKE